MTMVAAAAAAAGPQPPAGAMRSATSAVITAREGTNLQVIASPDGARLVLNLQNTLWSLPVTGGRAVRLTDWPLEPVKADWSPDGRRLVIQAYRDGMFHLYTLRPDGRGLKQITRGDFDDLDPRWSPDGKRIAFVSERGGNRDLWVLEVATGKARAVVAAGAKGVGPDVSAPAGMMGVPAWIADPAWSPDGGSIAFVRDKGLEVVELKNGAVRTVLKGPVFDLAAPSWSPDGKTISVRQRGGLWLVDAAGAAPPRQLGDRADVFPFPVTWLPSGEALYGATGRIWATAPDGRSREIPFEVSFEMQRPAYRRKAYDLADRAAQPVRGMVGPGLSPDGRRVVFKALNDLWLYEIGGAARRLTEDTYYEIDPAWSPDGRRVAFASDRAGSQDLYVMDVHSGETRRVSDAAGAEVAPAWSPDGGRLAYETQTGALAILDVSSGESRVLAEGLNAPGRPAWSPDGETLALAALHNARNHILTIDVATGARRFQEPAPGRSLTTRGDDGPVWSADGKWLVFSMGSTLWRAPVTPRGVLTGRAQQLTKHASDAPSLSRDGRRMLYLQNGELVLAELPSGRATRLDTGLTWRADLGEQPVLVRNVRIWDGVREAPAENQDLLVAGGRIAGLGPAGSIAPPPQARVVDGHGMTAVPGLFDMHNHQQLRSKFLGDRQGRAWLAFGVTSTRSTGDQAYRALEDREALASGARVGPRYFMSGEMFEGRSLEWEFARPVEDRAQLALELSRAEALGYDVIKTYVRFPFDLQQEVVRHAHTRMGVSVTSHYVYPSVLYGQDGAEHGGGPTRWEMSNTGGYYEDVVQAMRAARLEITTTNFSSAVGLADDPGLVDDPRVQALYPAWERKSLQDQVLCAQGRGPCGFLPPNAAFSKAAVERLTRLHRAGITVMAGTDAPLDNYALSLQLNLRALARYGMTNFEALQVATIIPARAQGVDRDLGSLEVGKLADVVLVQGDPSRRMDDLANVRAVMKGGRYFTVEELAQPFVPAAR